MERYNESQESGKIFSCFTGEELPKDLTDAGLIEVAPKEVVAKETVSEVDNTLRSESSKRVWRHVGKLLDTINASQIYKSLPLS